MHRILAWWYVAIAAGFVLLAADHLLVGDKIWLILIRLVIAAGFGLLAYNELRPARSKR